MARKASIVKNEKRFQLATKNKEKRDALRAILKSPTASFEEKMAASSSLTKMPRDTAWIRYRNRCMFTGRARGVSRKYRLSRLTFREMVVRGEIPGMTKSSW